MATFGGRGQRPGRPANVGGSGEIFIKAPVAKDAQRAKYWLLDKTPPMVVDDNGVPILDERGNRKPNWFNFEQHYDPSVKRSWPCACSEDAANCVGCEFPVEDPTNENDRGLSIQSTSSQYVIPVIDEKGYVSLIQFGFGIWSAFCDNWEIGEGTLDGAWWVISKTKQGQKISYTVTRSNDTNEPEVKADIPDDSYISHALGRRYLEAMQRYGYNPDAPNPFGDEAGDSVGGGQDEPTPASSQEGADLGGDPPTEPAPDAGSTGTSDAASDQPSEQPEGWSPGMVAREASVGELKDWLDNIPEGQKFGGPREYPKKPSRPVLVGLVEKAQTEFAPF